MRNPQRWNRYAYAANNPLQWVDKTGEFIQLPEACNDSVCEELDLLEEVLDEAGAEVQLSVGKNGVVEDVGEDLEGSDNDTISLLAGLINSKTNGVDFALTNQDLSRDSGANIKQVDQNLLRIRLNPEQVRKNIFTGIALSGPMAGGTVGGIGTPGPALVHELGHAAAFFEGFPFNEFRTRKTSNDTALAYENFHRSLLRGPENFRRIYHDEPRP